MSLLSQSLPHNLEAEAAVVGSLMIEPRLIAEVSGWLKPDMFYHYNLKTIYEAQIALFLKHAGEAVDIVLLRDELKKRNLLDEVGGVEYLKRVAESVPSSANCHYYANLVKDKAGLRTVICEIENLKSKISTPDMTAEIAVSAFEETLLKISPDCQQDITAIGDGMVDKINDIEKRSSDKSFTGISTGFHELDDFIGGLRNGCLYIVAGRPSSGKSTLCQNMMEANAQDGQPPLVFSLEASKEVWQERMLCSQAKVASHKMLFGALDKEDWQQVMTAAGSLSTLPIYIADIPELTPSRIMTDTIRYKHRHNIKVIYVDYLQLMSSGIKHGNREAEVAYISRQLKLLARKLNIPVVMLCQLSRKVEERSDKRPILSDLRESGSLEQDADVVLMLYREDYYTKPLVPTHVTEVIIAKTKNGMTGTVKLTDDLQYFRFENRTI